MSTTPRRSELTPNTLAKFEREVDKSGACWLWMSGCSADGYGFLIISRRYILAHRFSYFAFKGDIPEGYQIDHLCRVRNCVNPDHLEAVTPQENSLRGIGISAINARKTHCPTGHEYSPENTKLIRGKRYCRECSRAATRRWRSRAALQQASAS